MGIANWSWTIPPLANLPIILKNINIPVTKPRTRAATAPADTVIIRVSRVNRAGAT